MKNQQFFSRIYVVYAGVMFLFTMILLLPAFIVAAWGGPVKGANRVLRICMFWADCWMWLVCIRHKNLFEQPHDATKSYIFVANHISYFDAVILVKTIRQHFRPLGKVETSRIPIFGFIYRNAIVSVDRSDPQNRAESVMRLESLIRKGISVFVFPEGTFNMGHEPLGPFYDGAFRVAIETATPIKPILFLDGYTRMPYQHPPTLLPGLSRSVFLAEISVEGYTLEDLPQLKEKVHAIMSQKLSEYQAAWIRDSA